MEELTAGKVYNRLSSHNRTAVFLKSDVAVPCVLSWEGFWEILHCGWQPVHPVLFVFTIVWGWSEVLVELVVDMKYNLTVWTFLQGWRMTVLDAVETGIFLSNYLKSGKS